MKIIRVLLWIRFRSAHFLRSNVVRKKMGIIKKFEIVAVTSFEITSFFINSTQKLEPKYIIP